MRDPHLSDDGLAALCLDAGPAAASDHLAECPSCERRLVSMAAMLDEIADTAAATADAAFPAERRARQQSRILQRIGQHAGVGKVLAFPRARTAGAPGLRPTRVRRWVAGAAAAGLCIGMLAGHLVHELPALQHRASPQPPPAPRQPDMPLRAATAALADDEAFLREFERAVQRSTPVAFERLGAMTPVAWEVQR